MTNHLMNLISKAAHDLDHCISLDIGACLTAGDDIDFEAAMPLRTDDLAEDIIRYAGYADFAEAEADHLASEMLAADDLFWNARL